MLTEILNFITNLNIGDFSVQCGDYRVLFIYIFSSDFKWVLFIFIFSSDCLWVLFMETKKMNFSLGDKLLIFHPKVLCLDRWTSNGRS